MAVVSHLSWLQGSLLGATTAFNNFNGKWQHVLQYQRVVQVDDMVASASEINRRLFAVLLFLYIHLYVHAYTNSIGVETFRCMVQFVSIQTSVCVCVFNVLTCM